MPFEGHHAAMHHVGYTAPFNMSGKPAISVNCGHTDDERTVGLQVAGARGHDLQVLQAAWWFESVRETPDEPLWPCHDRSRPREPKIVIFRSRGPPCQAALRHPGAPGNP